MKKFIILSLVIGGLLAGSCILYGYGYEKPEGSNLSIVNNTGIDFSYIGFGNDEFATVLADADKPYLDKYEKHYFNLENLDKNNIWNIKAVDKNNNVYEGTVKLSKNFELVLKTVRDGVFKTNGDVDFNKNSKFDILSIVKGWYCKVEDNNILSKYIGPFKHATTVMGKGGKVSFSRYVSKNEAANAKHIRGEKAYSWISIYH